MKQTSMIGASELTLANAISLNRLSLKARVLTKDALDNIVEVDELKDILSSTYVSIPQLNTRLDKLWSDILTLVSGSSGGGTIVTGLDVNEVMDYFGRISVLKPHNDNGKAVHLKIEFYRDEALSKPISILNTFSTSNANARNVVYAYIGGNSEETAWLPMTNYRIQDGLGPEFDNYPVMIDLTKWLEYKGTTAKDVLSIDKKMFLKYVWFWIDEQGNEHKSDEFALVFPSIVEVGANAGGGRSGSSGNASLLSTKLNQIALFPQFDPMKHYDVGDLATYNGKLLSANEEVDFKDFNESQWSETSISAMLDNLSSLDTKYDKTGGEISGDVKILSGNYIQTTTPENVYVYSAGNSYIQAESTKYGSASIGSRGFIVVGIVSAENKVLLSVDGLSSVSASIPASCYNEKWSIALDNYLDAQFSEISAVGSNYVIFKNALKATKAYNGKELTAFTDLLTKKDDNALYCPAHPEVGNLVIPTFTSNHAEGGSTHATAQLAHAEGRASTAEGRYSHAEGHGTIAGGTAAHAEGMYTKALANKGAHAEGLSSVANGQSAHAEGWGTIASSSASHAEGYETSATTDAAAHAEGAYTEATGNSSHAEGKYSRATKTAAHAEGLSCYAYGEESHAEGYNTTASGNYSHSEGCVAEATGSYAHAEGYGSKAKGNASHAEGGNSSGYPGGTAEGVGSHAEGYDTLAKGNYAHAEGYQAKAYGRASHAEGYQTQVSCATLNNSYSHAEGYLSKATGEFGAHAEGYNTNSTNYGTHSEGRETIASGQYSHAEGYKSEATADSAHAEGGNKNDGKKGGTASGPGSHAEGELTQATGRDSHAEGYHTYTAGQASHAEGYETKATKIGAHSFGAYTEANGEESWAGGYSAIASNNVSFVWNGTKSGYNATTKFNPNKGEGTFCINPKNGLSGFYVGTDDFISCVVKAVQAIATDSTKKAALKTALQTVLA